MKQERLTNVLALMKERHINQIIVSDPAAIFYLTGEWIHPGERLLALVIREDGKHSLVVNKMFQIKSSLGIEIIYIDDVDNGIEILANQLEAGKIGVDKTWPAKFLLGLMQQTGQPVSEFVLGSEVMDDVRAHKTEEEKELMRAASRDNDEAVGRLIKLLPQELTELEMTEKLAEIYKELGNSGMAFEPIVAYGANGADPHHETNDDRVKPGDAVILDIGGVKNDYCSDMTRTVFYKEVSDRHRDIYEIVLEANKRAIAAVKPGVKFSEIDAAARDYITEKGYGEYFTHRTGHFIGIECHEAGDVSAANDRVVEPGNIFSIEPGIYIQGDIGVRIEDLIIATEDGYENLNHYNKELMIVG
ncbi:M24 family metallopeptidase [Vagococcus zengguangii]|uniref:Aminopeptidase P family protein n=1 Tax=Vagococcus zengguangii TaxID=2571750 RepID=A0A4D7CUF9_9ENTE|nr:Xaa-Pro peptidase family protein [Vagococcus zengguangii]QCI86973.1 aminopeptidase P family protein [Vagococcus zengguangii]TLG80984.1 aminopeptidase P family protein [Vagococcus zengguangii]